MKSLPWLAGPVLIAWLVYAGVTKNDVLFGTGVVAVVVLIMATLAGQLRDSLRAKAAMNRLWQTGLPAKATVVSITQIGGSQFASLVELVLRVEGGRQVAQRVGIPIVAIPRVQPGCVVDVRVDPTDSTRVALDPQLRT